MAEQSTFRLIEIKSDSKEKRTSVNLSLIIDVSGSMGSRAEIKNDKGNKEFDGFTLMDLTKHAAKTVILSMSENDQLSIISFSSSASILLKQMKITDETKKKAIAVINGLRPTGGTNIYSALKAGLSCSEPNERGLLNGMFLLTDGQSNCDPPRGVLREFQKSMEVESNYTILNTFGFGTDIDSELLDSLSRTCMGSFSFIPDGGMVGTIFIHNLANLYTTEKINVKLGSSFLTPETVEEEFEMLDVNEKIPLPETRNVNFEPRIFTGDETTIQCGQSRFMLIEDPLNPEEIRSVSVSYYDLRTKESILQNLPVEIVSHTDYRYTLLKLAQLLKELATKNHHIKQTAKLPQLENFVKLNSTANDEVKLILKNVKDQVIPALTTYYTTWGRHYLFSLTRALELQQRNNFKDCVSLFGGKLFDKLVEEINDIFNTTTLEPSITYDHRTGAHFAAKSMGSYNRSSAPCYTGDSLVLMHDCTYKRAADIRKGDLIFNGDFIDPFDTSFPKNVPFVPVTGSSGVAVDCVLKTVVNKVIPMVTLKSDVTVSSLTITPYHPMRTGQLTRDFKFPCDIAEPQETHVSNVYSFLLESDYPSVIVNGFETLALNHGSSSGINNHPFFTNSVRNYMSHCIGFQAGLIEITGTRRNLETGLVNGFRF